MFKNTASFELVVLRAPVYGLEIGGMLAYDNCSCKRGNTYLKVETLSENIREMQTYQTKQ